MWACPATAGTGLATRKSRGVDRHGLIENGLGLSVGGGDESGFETVKCYTKARWYFFICATYSLKTQGEEERAGGGLQVCSAEAI